MAQFARPSADVTVSNWEKNTGGSTNLYQWIDEVSPSDSDFIQSIPVGNLYTFSLSAVTDPGVNTGHVIRWRAQWNDGSGDFTWTLRLKEGATTRVTRSVFQSSGVVGFQTVSYTLTGTEADSITNYANLRGEFTLPILVGDESVGVSWFEFEVPNASTIVPQKTARNYVVGV